MAYKLCGVLSIIVFLNGISSQASDCPKGSECVPLSVCRPRTSHIFFPCHSGLNLYCCPYDGVINDTVTNILSRRKDVFPINCGVVFTDDKITGGENAELGQFPWMVLLGYQQIQINAIEYLCGGSLITETFVLTAGHCLGIGATHKLVHVRLGELDLNTEIDCRMAHNSYICSDEPVNIPVLSYFVHESFDTHNLKNDIALVKLSSSVTFSDYIQPICLPFERNLEHRDLTGQKLTVSGWGKINSKKLSGSSILQFASVFVWDHQKCNQAVPPEVYPIIYSQLCANGEKQDACKGDSGGPLFNTTTDIDDNIRSFQIGIVSFATTLTCGIAELPPIYTRVDRYLSWIVNIVEKNT